MKTRLKILMVFLFLICATVFCIRVSAAEPEKTGSITLYTVKHADSGGYDVYSDTSGNATVFHTDTLSLAVSFITEESGTAEIFLSDIICEESLAFEKGKYSVSGRINFKGTAGIVIDGSEIVFKNLKAELESAEIRLKRGGLLIENSFINSKKSTIKIDYSSSAYLTMRSGEITASSEVGAIVVSYGTLEIGGGTVKNSTGPAIFSASTLVLHGEPLLEGVDSDVYLKAPMTLSKGEKNFTGRCSVKFDREFEKGKIAVIAYGAAQESEDRITLYDSFGRKQDVKFYEHHSGIDERNFLTAYLPYEIKFSGETESVQYKLLGEKIDIPIPKERDGYEFLGWICNESENETLEINATATGDRSFYPSYGLNAPSFALSSMEFVYCEEGKYLSLDRISHPLLSEGVIAYKWFKDGEELSLLGNKVLIKNTFDSGKYKCLFTFSYKSDSVTVETPEVTVTVLKKLIEVPDIPSVEYDGREHMPKIYPPSTYTISGEGGVDAGTYPIKFSVTDPQNYGFFPDGNESITLDFIIRKAENEWIEPLTVKDFYVWESLSAVARAKYGEISFVFSDSSDGEYTALIPKTAGSYFIKATVAETDNYFGLQSMPIQFKITEDELSSIYVVNDALKREYAAFERFSPEGLTLCALYISGRQEELSLSDIEISYHRGKGFLFGDSSVLISYGNRTIYYPVTVKKVEYDISGIVFENCVYEYTGKYISPKFEYHLPTGLDEIPLKCEILGGGTNVGEYAVELRFYTDSKNYIIPQSIRRVMTVIPKAVEIVWENLSFVYDGELKLPVAYFTDIYEEKVFLKVSGAHSRAGFYEARAVFEGKNYFCEKNTAVFEIVRAEYDMTGVFWSAERFVYNGNEQSVLLMGLPSGVAVIGYTDNFATQAGVYTAAVTLSYDTENYNPPKVNPYQWEILKAEYDMSGIEFLDAEFVYDGNKHFPTVLGGMPTGLDGSVAKYSFSGSVINVNEGKTLVKVSFFTDSKNYNAPLERYCFVSILPLEIEVRWENTEFVYSGDAFAPRAHASECEISVQGAAENAGKHTATAIALDSNYKVKNSKCDYEIFKAENGWSIIPGADDIYASQLLAVKGCAAFGKTEYIYSNADFEIITKPNTHGIFYFKAVSSGDENHLPLSSEWIKFLIIEVVPLDFYIEMTRSDYLTLEKLTEADFRAFVKNNDSSTVEIPFSEISVSYQNGEHLRLSDEHVIFSYLDFRVIENISVSKRDYDLSGVVWEGLKTVYDGSAKYATVSGLPIGIEVVEYIGNGSVNAGIYVIRAVLVYDEENYNRPSLADAVMTVEKQTVTLPDIKSATYTSKPLFPDIEASDLYTYAFSGATSAGEYKVVFKLTDSDNYTFEGNLSTAEKNFYVDKIKITVQVKDVEKYLFGKYSEPEYVILSGNLIEGEEIHPIFDVRGDEVFAVFRDSNYDVYVVGGRVKSYNRLSPEDTRLFVFLFIAFIFTLVSVILITVNRKRILRLYRAAFLKGDAFVPVPPVVLEEEDFDSCNGIENDGGENVAFGQEENAEREAEDDGIPDIDITVSASTVIDAEYADSAITDSLARNLIRREEEIKTSGSARRIINVDILSRSFSANDRVDINILKNKRLIPYDTGYIKVLARGIIDKPLTVYANDFSLSAVKMIALAGGKSVKVSTTSEQGVNFRKRT